MHSRRRAIVIAGAAVVAAALFAMRPSHQGLRPRPARERPTLLLLTSLPIVFGEDFSIQRNGSPALKALETRYRVIPISVTGEAELAKGRLLLMAQPTAQPADDLVALDEWLRRGGRLLLLADPALEWPSTRALGDPLRPPATFMDTGLLAHWGLRLDPIERRGPHSEELGGFDILAVSPGHLSGTCAVSSGALVAHCRIGKGEATIVADADLLDVPDLGKGARHNLDGVLRELAELERP